MRLHRKIHNNSSYCFLLFHGFVRSKHKNNNNKKRKLSNPPLHLTLVPFKNYLFTKASFLERHDTQSIVWKIRFVVAWLAVLELAQAICPLHAHIRALLVLQLSTCFKQTMTQERGIGHEYVCHLRAVQCTSRLGSRADTSARPWRQKWPGIAFTGLGSSPPQMAMALTSRGQSPASPASPLACCPHGPCLDRGYWLQGFRCLKTLKWHWHWCWCWHWHCVFEHLYAMNTPVWRWYIRRLV